MRDFTKLAVWEKSHQLVLAIYQATYHFPVEERYALTSQIRRSAASIPANIAEGCGKNTEAELARLQQFLWDQPVNWNIIIASSGSEIFDR